MTLLGMCWMHSDTFFRVSTGREGHAIHVEWTPDQRPVYRGYLVRVNDLCGREIYYGQAPENVVLYEHKLAVERELCDARRVMEETACTQ